MPTKNIPDIIISRLPIYLRALQRFTEQGIQTISSQELGERVGISAAQIRKDLSQFGEFGKQGTGYYIPFLMDKIRAILKVDRIWDVAIVGMGDVGHAVARYPGFTNRGFQVTLLFDADPNKVGQRVGNLEIKAMDVMVSEIRRNGVKIAMVAVPAAAAQEVVNLLVEAGVKAILNYAPISLSVPPDVRVQYIDPAIGLQRMTYYIED